LNNLKIVTLHIKLSFSKYQIVLQQQAQQNRKKRDFSLKSDGCNSTQLFDYSVSQEKGLTCYITAKIDVDTDGETTFNIADGKTYGGYENVALAPGADYLLVVVVLVKAEVRISLSQMLLKTQIIGPTSLFNRCQLIIYCIIKYSKYSCMKLLY